MVTSGRNKFSCPLRCSSKPVYQLPRHLTKVHGWDKERARNAVNHYGLRHDQRNSKKPKEVRQRRRQKYCLEYGRKERYLSKHLQNSHGYKKGTKKYWNALKESRPVYQWKTKYGDKAIKLQLLEKHRAKPKPKPKPSTALTIDTDEITEEEDGEVEDREEEDGGERDGEEEDVEEEDSEEEDGEEEDGEEEDSEEEDGEEEDGEEEDSEEEDGEEEDDEVEESEEEDGEKEASTTDFN